MKRTERVGNVTYYSVYATRNPLKKNQKSRGRSQPSRKRGRGRKRSKKKSPFSWLFG